MKKVFLFTFLLLSGLCFAQDVERVIIDGNITVPAGFDPEGIVIYNNASNEAAVSSESGNFFIPVALGDQLTFMALQFEEFSIVIDRQILEAREVNVFIQQAINELPEVVVSTYDLTGSVRLDVKRIPVVSFDVPLKSAAEINPHRWYFKPDQLTSPTNAAMGHVMRENGLRIGNIFRAIFDSDKDENEEFEPIDEKVRRLYDDEFFQEYLNIKKKNINEFIFFAKDNGLTKEMLQEGNEMDLIGFLLAQSKRYKFRNDKSNALPPLD